MHWINICNIENLHDTNAIVNEHNQCQLFVLLQIWGQVFKFWFYNHNFIWFISSFMTKTEQIPNEGMFMIPSISYGIFL